MVNWWFGILRVPLSNKPFYKWIPNIQGHQAPNQQLTINYPPWNEHSPWKSTSFLVNNHQNRGFPMGHVSFREGRWFLSNSSSTKASAGHCGSHPVGFVAGLKGSSDLCFQCAWFCCTDSRSTNTNNPKLACGATSTGDMARGMTRVGWEGNGWKVGDVLGRCMECFFFKKFTIQNP